MKLWLKKISAVLITILTVGMYVPPSFSNASAEDDNDDFFASGEGNNSEFSGIEDTSGEEIELDEEDFSAVDSGDDYIQIFMESAKEQTLHKLGPKISNKVEDEFMDGIFPGMEEAISTLFDDMDEDAFNNLAIDEQHSSYYGEKIFNIYDQEAGQEVARFHVRRDQRPKEGYWFNFHYHLSEDNFEEHHDLGEIYWDKNTPPKWMS